ncbi:DUF2478 domain-containing protein [Magnetovibrio sp. PR-2]|uniref:DUF2478 domain-containing protein n=1 Tax=Magnetovibrio sp. PR-2 TaxID=3120356 RepID=UPI002FCE1EA7
MSSVEQSEPVVVGVVYERGEPIRDVMKGFVDSLQAQGLNVHGILQEQPGDIDVPAESCGVDAIDINTRDKVELVRPTQYELDNKICSLDLSRLAEAAQILRRAIAEGADIVVVEKFGKHEKDGGGISDDLMAVIAEPIPTVVSVPKNELKSWNAFTGGMDVQLTCDLQALQSWWETARS